jgi:hypothetical protein
MALKSYFVTYETDDSKEVIIKLNYDEDTGDARISEGGFAKIGDGCKAIITRKYLKPRYVDRVKNGKIERIYFKEHSKWLAELKKKETAKACGECLSCSVLQLIY